MVYTYRRGVSLLVSIDRASSTASNSEAGNNGLHVFSYKHEITNVRTGAIGHKNILENMKRIKYFLVFAMLLAGMTVKGQEFNYAHNGSVLVYKILDEAAKTCEVAGVENVTGMVNIPSTAVYEDYSGGITVTNVEYTVIGIGKGAFEFRNYGITNITIPNTVTSIGDWAFSNVSGLTSIIIPNSVTHIGNYAFSNCTSLTNVIVSNSVTYIGDGAFSGCGSLTNMIIPNSVTSIGRAAFGNCKELTEIIIPSSVKQLGDPNDGAGEVFTQCTNLKNIKVSSENAYYMDIDGILFDKAVTELHRYPEGKSLKTYTIPNTVTSIKRAAFNNCVSLATVLIPNTVISIGEGAFSGCTGLVEMNIPNSVTSIGNSAFNRCLNLTNLTVSNSITSIGSAAFRDCINLTEITLPNSLTRILAYTFQGCTSLKAIIIPNLVTGIGSHAFSGCTNLSEVTLSNSLMLISDRTFRDCSNLKTITIPNSVQRINEEAFRGCLSLMEITLPNLVNYVGNYAFKDCKNLQKVHSNNPVPPSLGRTVFGSINKDATLYVPIGSKDDYMATDWGRYFFDVIEEQVSLVDHVEVSRNPVDNVIYTVNGQRVNATDVNTLPAGMYIVNGRKVIIT
jgi:hypothetical protein